MVEIEYLKWDSDFFDLRIGRIYLNELILTITPEEILRTARLEKYNVLYLFTCCDTPLIHDYSKKLSASLVDCKVTFTKNITNCQEVNTNKVESYSSSVVSDELYSLALQSGQYSRFKVDVNFGNNAFEKLYKVWIDNSINRKIADEVFVVRENEKEIGFITLNILNNTATIGLLAVDMNYRNKTIGRILIAKVEQYCYEKGVKSIEVATQQNNINACRFYERNGFQILKCEAIYHLWI